MGTHKKTAQSAQRTHGDARTAAATETVQALASGPLSVSARSAQQTLIPRPLRIIGLLCLITAGMCLWFAPLITLQLCGMAVSVLILTLSVLRILACFSPSRIFIASLDDASPDDACPDDACPDDVCSDTSPADWPLYTVLVPLKDEAHMIQSLMAALSRLDYPQERLQILLITEANDPATTAAVAAAIRPPFQAVIVPQGGPKTKPNALNYAMQFSNGDIITIYDAEDHPDAAQLKTAALALHANPHWGAVQAPLDYFNPNDSLITRQFAIEYAALFHVWVPFLARLGLPFPLGGTSNHMRRAALLQTGGWDAHNVTEDADLSFRLGGLGWDIGYISPPTLEEAVGDWNGWCDQRVRWMKGYLQTWLVHMSMPLAPHGIKAWKRQFTLQITLGASLLSGLFHALIMAAFLGAYLCSQWQGQTLSVPLYLVVTFFISYGSGLMISAVGAVRARRAHLLGWVALTPLYWLSMVAPSWIAVLELWRKPYHWRKTAHGLSKQAAPIVVPLAATAQ